MTRGRSWMDIALGLLLGLSIGLAVAWWVAPNTRINRTPAALAPAYQDEYRQIVAAVYHYTGDSGRARVRLAQLHEEEMVTSLLDQSRRIRTGQAGSTIFPASASSNAEYLARLADALSAGTSMSDVTPTVPPPAASMPPTATLMPFKLVSQETLCDEYASTSLAGIHLRNSTGEPVPGVEILITWKGGQQQIVTGLKPVFGEGYADFIMIPGIRYMLQIPPASFEITEVTAPMCTRRDGSEYAGSLLLLFEQP